MRRALTFGFGGAAAGYGALRFLGRTAGSTRAERRARLAGDAMVRRPQIITDHGIDISAPTSQVWPWLTQMGWHLGGYYTPAWVDRWLFRANWSSLDALDPALVRDLRVGDVILDGPPGTAQYVVAEVGPGFLVLRSSTHVPTGWERSGAGIDWTWCLLLTPRMTDAGPGSIFGSGGACGPGGSQRSTSWGSSRPTSSCPRPCSGG